MPSSRALVALALTVASIGLGACGSSAGKSADAANDGTDAPADARDAVADLTPALDAAAKDGAPAPDAAAKDDAAGGDTASPADVVYRRDAAADGHRPDGGAGPYHAVAIATGLYHSCALLDDGNVKCWGLNTAGQLGYGDTFRRGADPSEMGDNLPVVDLGKGRFATAIAAGGKATCVLLENGAVKCWGAAGLAGLPGDGKNDRGDSAGEMGDALPEVNLGDHAARLVGVGAGAACALLDDASVRCWGPDVASLTPVPVSLGSTTAVAALAGAEHGMLVLFADGTAKTLFAKTPTPLLGPGVHATQLAGGSRGNCALVGGVLTCVSEGFQSITEPLDQFFHYGIADADGGVAQYVGPTPLPPLLRFGQTDQGESCAIFEGGRVGCQATVSWWPCVPDWCAASTASGDGTEFMNLGQPATALTTGGEQHICGLLANGEVRCWGGGDHPLMPNDALGSSFDMKEVNGRWTYGAFHSVNLGTHR
jgi:hypothetical protein